MPLSTQQLEELQTPMRNLKIICGALIIGVSIAAIVICTIIDLANLKTDLVMLVAMAAATGAVMFSTSFVAFKIVSSQVNSRKDSLKSHFDVLQNAWIVRFAIIEGACFLNLVVTLLENSLITLFMATLGLLIMLLTFPRTMKVEELLESRLNG